MRHIRWVFGILVLSLCDLIYGSTMFVISPSNSIASCKPVARCFTLSQFAANSERYLLENTTLFLQPGNHTLDSEFTVSNITHFSLMTLRLGMVNVACSRGGKLILESIKNALITGITFTHCIGNKISNMDRFSLSQSTFIGPFVTATGTALQLHNTTALVSQCLFSSYLFGSIQFIHRNLQQAYSLKTTTVWAGGVMIANNSNVTILQSNFKGNRAQFGGAVYTVHSIVTITSSTFDFNTANSSHSSTAASGGALFAINSTIFVYNSTMTKNNVYYGYARGGAIGIIDSNLTVQSSLVRGNSAIDVGGALHAISSLVVMINCTCHSNKANNGGSFGVNQTTLMIQHTVLQDSRVFNSGGAIFATKSVVAIEKSIVIDNFAELGGAIYSSTSSVKIRGSIITKNIAIKDGGGVYCIDSCEVRSSETTFESNAVEEKGGVIKVDKRCIVIISHCKFANNTATSGGVLSADTFYNIITINQCEFRHNMAYAVGGAIKMSKGVLYISNTSFMSNQARSGGAIGVDKSSFVSQSCVLSNNLASREGIVNVAASNASFTNTVISFNEGGKGLVFLYDSNATFTNNTVVTNAGSFVATNSSIVFLGYNIFKNNSNDNYTTISQFGGALTLIHSTLKFYGPMIAFVNNSAIYGGAINANMSRIINKGRLLAFKNFASKSGGAMYVYHSELQCNGTMHFMENVALSRGGGVDAVSSSMSFSSNCSMMFDRNWAISGDDIIMDTI